MAGRWADVGEAARELGISTDAVRKRVSRGSLRSEKTDGSVRVWLDSGGTETGHDDELVDELRDRVRYLEGQVEQEREARRRADVMLSRLMDRLPELEAARAPEGDDTTAEAQTDTHEPQTGTQRLPWWRRWFDR